MGIQKENLDRLHELSSLDELDFAELEEKISEQYEKKSYNTTYSTIEALTIGSTAPPEKLREMKREIGVV